MSGGRRKGAAASRGQAIALVAFAAQTTIGDSLVAVAHNACAILSGEKC